MPNSPHHQVAQVGAIACLTAFRGDSIIRMVEDCGFIGRPQSDMGNVGLERGPTPADNPLLDMDDVVITPHMASFARESLQKGRTFPIRNAARVAGGHEPLSVVLPD